MDKIHFEKLLFSAFERERNLRFRNYLNKKVDMKMIIVQK